MTRPTAESRGNWKFPVVMAFSLGLVFFFCANPVLAEPRVYALSVDGLACPFCAYGVEKKVSALPGVAKIEIRIETGTVLATMEEGKKLAEPAVRAAVEAAGFTLRKFQLLSPQRAGKSG